MDEFWKKLQEITLWAVRSPAIAPCRTSTHGDIDIFTSHPWQAGPDPLCVVITESHTEIQEILGHVLVGLRAYSYLFWLTDSNTKVYGLHALMFMTEAAANHRIHRGRSQSHYFPLIMTAIMPSMYHKAHKVKAELHSKATQKTSSKVYLALSAPAPGQTFRDNKISFGILL